VVYIGKVHGSDPVLDITTFMGGGGGGCCCFDQSLGKNSGIQPSVMP
jgi:hypothetical protein